MLIHDGESEGDIALTESLTPVFRSNQSFEREKHLCSSMLGVGVAAEPVVTDGPIKERDSGMKEMVGKVKGKSRGKRRDFQQKVSSKLS